MTIAMTIRSLDVAHGYDIVQIRPAAAKSHQTLDANQPHRDHRQQVRLGSAMSFVTHHLTLIFTLYLFRRLLEIAYRK
jgi:hypothetical protein